MLLLLQLLHRLSRRETDDRLLNGTSLMPYAGLRLMQRTVAYNSQYLDSIRLLTTLMRLLVNYYPRILLHLLV